MEFLNVLLPIFGIFVLGFIGQKKFHLDIKSISTMTVYLMSPVLVFRTFSQSTFHMDHIYLAIYAFLLCIGIILVVYVLAFFKKYETTETCSLVLASAFMNSGNYGTPVVMLLFGAAGLELAIILLVIQQMVMATIGVYYAAKGSSKGSGFKTAIQAVVRMPMLYAAIIGVLFQWLHIPLSESVFAAVNLVADAAIPTIMITLGMQLANISIKKLEKQMLTWSLVFKLALSPFIAFIITLLLPVDEMVKQIMIILAAMPTAANTTMLALLYNTKPDFVSSATLMSTVLSLVTLPIIFAIIL